MNIDLDIQYIDRDHRVGTPNSAVRFTSWRARQKFMKSEKAVFEHNKKYRHYTMYLKISQGIGPKLLTMLGNVLKTRGPQTVKSL